jgi:hypothetical protein
MAAEVDTPVRPSMPEGKGSIPENSSQNLVLPRTGRNRAFTGVMSAMTQKVLKITTGHASCQVATKLDTQHIKWGTAAADRSLSSGVYFLKWVMYVWVRFVQESLSCGSSPPETGQITQEQSSHV